MSFRVVSHALCGHNEYYFVPITNQSIFRHSHLKCLPFPQLLSDWSENWGTRWKRIDMVKRDISYCCTILIYIYYLIKVVPFLLDHWIQQCSVLKKSQQQTIVIIYVSAGSVTPAAKLLAHCNCRALFLETDWLHDFTQVCIVLKITLELPLQRFLFA